MIPTLRRLALGGALFAVLALGLTVAALATSTRTDNYAAPAVACGAPVKVAFTNFPNNGRTNTVTVGVSGVYAQFQFVGAAGTYTSPVVAGTGTWVVSESWDTNGVSGSDTATTKLSCPTRTITTTTPSPVRTVTVPTVSTVTVTTPAPPTVTATSTVTTPAPRITCHNGYKQTGAYSCLKTVTKVRTVVKWRTRTVVKTRTVVRKPKCPKPSVKQLCAAGGGTYANGKCGFVGKG